MIMDKKEKMTVLEFCEEYSQAEEKGKMDLLSLIIKRTYTPVLEKRVILQKMLDQSVVEQENGVRYIDMLVSRINYTMALIILYTNLEIDLKDGKGRTEDMYDSLVKNNIVSDICEYIGTQEMAELNSVNKSIIDTFYNQYGSTEAFIGNAIANIGQKIGVASGWVIQQIDEIINDENKFSNISSKIQEVLNTKR